ncbi:MAG: hypothetical protein IPG10_19765 [Flavobacteriales bacterium]|nr:hypothetical protein [Flavobacteriales bacterium]
MCKALTQTADGGLVVSGSVRLSFNGDFFSLSLEGGQFGASAWARLGTAQHPVSARVVESPMAGCG